MAEVELAGCAPAPLASYLKGLGVLRLVGRQADPEARGWWRDDLFVLKSALDEDGLVPFFLDRYRPTPVVSPWNRGTGFHPTDRRAASLERIERETSSDRFDEYRRTIAAARAALQASAETESKDRKVAQARRCRALVPDAALEWLDAAVVLTSDGLAYPPLLVSGGNDGHLDFSNNFMQRLCDVLPELWPDDLKRPRERSSGWLRASLLGEQPPALKDAAVGMFNPGGAGGANATADFKGESLVNPWDFVLMVEGIVLFAGAAARRLSAAESAARPTFPFMVQPASAGVLLGASPSEQVRAEIWLPLWRTPTSVAEVEHLCSEGRAQWGRRQARDGVEFAEAIASLGVARGVDDFVRYAVYERMGNNHVATPVRRVQVRRRPQVDLLAQIDPWLRLFRDRVGQEAPAALRDVRQRLEQAIFELCLHGDKRTAQEVLVALGRAELAFAGREALADDYRPLHLRHRWLSECDDGSPELRLSAALGSIGGGTIARLRTNLEPVAVEERGRLVRRRSKTQVWAGASPARDLAAVFQRRLLDAEMAGASDSAFAAARHASLWDVARLLRGEVALDRLADLTVACSLVDWPRDHRDDDGLPLRLPPTLPRAYALLKLCCLPFSFELDRQENAVPQKYAVSIEPAIFAALAAGDVPHLAEALRRAAVRLRGSGLPLHAAAGSAELARSVVPGRLLPALLVPITPDAATALAKSITRRSEVTP